MDPGHADQGSFAMFMVVAVSITALPVLAAIVRERGAAGTPAGTVAIAAAGFLDVALFAVVRPVLRWWLERPAAVMNDPVPVALVLALGSAWVTESLGPHAVFGGFLAGLAMPRRDGAPNVPVLGADGLAVLGVILLVAVVGKTAPAYGVARLHVLDARQSALVTTFMTGPLLQLLGKERDKVGKKSRSTEGLELHH
ncbi:MULTISPECIES: hypothetical protein [unclassified Streptomyces]|uniref:hypothetical protein n=1 Tax=unclassified Streptomyces TaxID=2593676 RepID=UPI00336ABA49